MQHLRLIWPDRTHLAGMPLRAARQRPGRHGHVQRERDERDVQGGAAHGVELVADVAHHVLAVAHAGPDRGERLLQDKELLRPVAELALSGRPLVAGGDGPVEPKKDLKGAQPEVIKAVW